MSNLIFTTGMQLYQCGLVANGVRWGFEITV